MAQSICNRVAQTVADEGHARTGCRSKLSRPHAGTTRYLLHLGLMRWSGSMAAIAFPTIYVTWSCSTGTMPGRSLPLAPHAGRTGRRGLGELRQALDRCRLAAATRLHHALDELRQLLPGFSPQPPRRPTRVSPSSALQVNGSSTSPPSRHDSPPTPPPPEVAAVCACRFDAG
jgi:hypothetical protein